MWTIDIRCAIAAQRREQSERAAYVRQLVRVRRQERQSESTREA